MCEKLFCITSTSVESGFASLAQVWKVVLQHEHKCVKWFGTPTQVRKVVLHYKHKCVKWFCIASPSVESGFALLAQVWKVGLQYQRKCESGFQCHHKCGKWFCITSTSVESGFASLAQGWKVLLQHEHNWGKWISTQPQVQEVVLQH